MQLGQGGHTCVGCAVRKKESEKTGTAARGREGSHSSHGSVWHSAMPQHAQRVAHLCLVAAGHILEGHLVLGILVQHRDLQGRQGRQQWGRQQLTGEGGAQSSGRPTQLGAAFCTATCIPHGPAQP